MAKQENPGNLIQFLASYRRVDFPQDEYTVRKLASITGAIESNCAVTIRFADAMLRKMREDGEELFCLYSLRDHARALRRACQGLGTGRHSRIPGINYKVVTLRSQYDTFISSLRHFFFLLDHDLAGRIDGAF
jgi:hypothetical protein